MASSRTTLHRAADRPEVTEFAGMLTGCSAMRETFELVRKVAQTDANVLLRGETGTGKELVARAIHAHSGRAEQPFLAVNCATFQADLLASELFGHVRGAFTGAVADRRGLFARADGGSLLLDEIAELDLDLQARLLRVLQEKTFVPVGGTEAVRVDLRLLAATHRALRSEVEAGRFRADLMYRVRVVPIFLPPLRERPGDILALAWHFIDVMNATHVRQIDAMDDDARDALMAHDWPGIVRELRNLFEYTYAVGEGPVLRLADLTPELRGERPPGPPRTARELEREQILDALRATQGRKTEAAAALGISRSTLWRRMREHGL